VSRGFWVPDGFSLTLAWWHNAQVTRRRLVGGRRVDASAWFKHLSHGRPFAEFSAGQIEPHPQGYGGRCANATVEGHDTHGPWGDGHQVAVICAPHTRVVAVDVDDPAAFAAAALAGHVALNQAASRRGAGWHALVYVPPELLDRFPTQGPIPGGDLKANGFVPLPGSVHWSGEAYAPVPGSGLVVATADLLAAAAADRQAAHAASRAAAQGNGSSAAEGDEPALFAYCGQLVAAGHTRAEAWRLWLARAEALPARVAGWPWSEADEDVFNRQWEYCLDRHVANHGEAPTSLSPAHHAWLVANSREAEESGERVSEGHDGTTEGDAADGYDLEDVLDPPPVDPTLAALWPGEEPYRVPTDPVWYEVRGDGVVTVEGRDEQVAYLAFRPLLVSGLRVTEDGEERYEVAWLDRDGERRLVVLAAEDVSTANLARAFPAAVINPRRVARLAEYLAHCVRVNEGPLRAGRERVATALGWLGEGTATFVAGPGRPCQVEDVKNAGEWLAGHRPAGELATWRAAVAACQDRPLVLTVVVAGLAAPLLRLVGAPSFAVDVSGSTSTGKTISQLLSAAAWGDPAALVLSWQNTAVASEHYLSVLRGLPLYLSESQLATEAGVEQLVYALVEGRSKGRSRQDGAGLLDARRFETVVISSGERPLTSFTRKGGVVPRVVTLAGEPFGSADAADAARDAALASHGEAGTAFLAALDGWDGEKLRARHRAWRDHLRAGVSTAVGARRAESVAVLALAGDVATHAGLLPKLSEGLWPWLATGGDALHDDEEDRSRQALEVLLRAVALQQLSFLKPPDSFQGAPLTGWLGRYDPGEFVAVSPEWLRKLLAGEGHDYETVVRAWRDRGWLQCEPGKLTQTVRMGTQTPKLVKVRLTAVENQVETDLLTELDGGNGPEGF
jgi:hypothetical protein